MEFNNWSNEEKVQDASAKTKQRYDRLAPYFDLVESFLEALLFKQRRKLLWNKVEGKHILEVGVGTGKNFAYYPTDCQITAIDFSTKMLQRAESKKLRIKLSAQLEEMDVESLCYADNSFDTVVATFVFCSVAQPHIGLKELYRVCKPGGQVLLLEHVLSSNSVLSKIMCLLNPLIVRVIGANINRKTVKTVQSCGFAKVILDSSSGDMLKLIQAIK